MPATRGNAALPSRLSLFNRMVGPVGAQHATPCAVRRTYRLNGFVRTQRDASVHTFLIISYPLVARMGRPPLGPRNSRQRRAYPIIPFQPNGGVSVRAQHATPCAVRRNRRVGIVF